MERRCLLFSSRYHKVQYYSNIPSYVSVVGASPSESTILFSYSATPRYNSSSTIAVGLATVIQYMWSTSSQSLGFSSCIPRCLTLIVTSKAHLETMHGTCEKYSHVTNQDHGTHVVAGTWYVLDSLCKGLGDKDQSGYDQRIASS